MSKCRNNGKIYHCRRKGRGHPFLNHAHEDNLFQSFTWPCFSHPCPINNSTYNSLKKLLFLNYVHNYMWGNKWYHNLKKGNWNSSRFFIPLCILFLVCLHPMCHRLEIDSSRPCSMSSRRLGDSFLVPKLLWPTSKFCSSNVSESKGMKGLQQMNKYWAEHSVLHLWVKSSEQQK